jgi:hypothetical protein
MDNPKSLKYLLIELFIPLISIPLVFTTILVAFLESKPKELILTKIAVRYSFFHSNFLEFLE